MVQRAGRRQSVLVLPTPTATSPLQTRRRTSRRRVQAGKRWGASENACQRVKGAGCTRTRKPILVDACSIRAKQARPMTRLECLL